MDARTAIVAVAITFGLAGSAQAQLAAPSVPSVQVPSVQVPSVQVPSVQVPQVPVPSAPQVPSVQTPSVQTPAVQTPSVPVPQPSLPSGGGSAPSGSAPSAGGGGSGGGGSSGSSGGSGSGGRVPAQAPASGRGEGAMRDQGAGDGGGSGSGGGEGRGGSGGSDAVRGGRAGRQSTRSRFLARERRLRDVVRRLESCLSVLPRLTARVLVLRAGLGPADPLSRGQVARRVDRPTRVVWRIERRGVKRLKNAVRSGECSAATASELAPDGAGVPGSYGPATPATIDLAADGTGGSEGTVVGGVTDDGGRPVKDGGGVKGESGDNLGSLGTPSLSPTDITLPLVLALLPLAGYGAWRVHQRYRGELG